MSEIQRHTDAVDEELILHTNNTRSREELELEVSLAKLKVRRVTMRAGTVLGILLISLLFLAIYSVVARNNAGQAAAADARRTAEANGREISRLSTQLDETKHQLAARTQQDTDILVCKDRFTNLQRSTNLAAFATQAEMIVALIPSDPPEDRATTRAHLLAISKRLDKAVATYQASIDQSVAWVNSNYTLPCPLTG